MLHISDPPGIRGLVYPGVRHALGRFILAGTLFAIVGCVSESPPEPLAEAHPPAIDPEQAAIDPEQVADLLEVAAEALEDERLITPLGDSAYDRYQDVLALAPGDPAALNGLERIVQQFLERASQAAAQGYFARARSMLDRARIVDPEHPEITLLDQQVTLLAEATRLWITLDRHAIAARDSNAAARLRTIGTRAKQPNTRVTIIARSDAEGRWMYQQMRSAPGDRRISAELTIGSPPSIELLELNCSEAVC